MRKYIILVLLAFDCYGAASLPEDSSRPRSASACARIMSRSAGDDSHRLEEAAERISKKSLIRETFKNYQANMLLRKHIRKLEAKYSKGYSLYTKLKSNYVELRGEYLKLEAK